MPGVECRLSVVNLEVYAGGSRILSIPRLGLGPGLHAIIGPNGSGKTTLLRALAGLMGYEGEASVCGLPPRSARERVSYMPAVPAVDPLARVEDVVEAGLYRAPRPLPDPGQALRRVGVGRLRGRRFATLSSGEQRLVCLARALARGAEALLLDEPLSFLDVSNKVRVLGMLRQEARRLPVLVTTHELHYIGFFDTVTLLDRGRLAYHGTPQELEAGVLEEVYGVRLVEARLDGFRAFIPLPAPSGEHPGAV